tara:strand:+ start:469 stop:723 length:255 start_codon:yes stop_codon:yes gene_type:complete
MVYLTTFLNMALGLFKSVSQRQSAVNGFPFNFGCGNNASEAETTFPILPLVPKIGPINEKFFVAALEILFDCNVIMIKINRRSG